MIHTSAFPHSFHHSAASSFSPNRSFFKLPTSDKDTAEPNHNPHHSTILPRNFSRPIHHSDKIRRSIDFNIPLNETSDKASAAFSGAPFQTTLPASSRTLSPQTSALTQFTHKALKSGASSSSSSSTAAPSFLPTVIFSSEDEQKAQAAALPIPKENTSRRTPSPMPVDRDTPPPSNAAKERNLAKRRVKKLAQESATAAAQKAESAQSVATTAAATLPPPVTPERRRRELPNASTNVIMAKLSPLSLKKFGTPSRLTASKLRKRHMMFLKKHGGLTATVKSEHAAAAPIRYGKCPFSKIAMQYKIDNGITAGRNVAVISYLDTDGEKKYTIAATTDLPGSTHAELKAYDLLPQPVRAKPESILAVYTERQPCRKGSNCADKLAAVISKSTHIYWSVAHPTEAISRRHLELNFQAHQKSLGISVSKQMETKIKAVQKWNLARKGLGKASFTAISMKWARTWKLNLAQE